MPTLREIRFRSSPHVDLKQLAELPEEQRRPFQELERDPDFYGLFVPKPPLTMNLQAVPRQTAELFRSLTAASLLDDRWLGDGDVVDLVLDGILEIESGDGFVSGAAAFPLVCPLADPPALRDAAARLSRDALLHAQDLEENDPQALSMALYYYNRMPLTPFWKTRFAGSDAILAHLGADRGPLRALLDRSWNGPRQNPAWLSWSPRISMPHGADDVTYKLYVSPRPERIRDAFEIVVRVLSDFPETPFKIGADAAGLLRPDKLVAYFTTRALLDEAAALLRRELAGCDAHGVPFSSGLDDDGLLSWGVDPPDNERALQWLGRESWRLWVAKRLGAALSIAKATPGAAVEPWHFAIERARRHGIDVESWTPSARLWSGE